MISSNMAFLPIRSEAGHSEIFLRNNTVQWRIRRTEASITASHAYSHHLYRVSTLVSMITGSTKLFDMGSYYNNIHSLNSRIIHSQVTSFSSNNTNNVIHSSVY